jgi:hypothetical protein
MTEILSRKRLEEIINRQGKTILKFGIKIERQAAVLKQAREALHDADCKCYRHIIPGHFEAAPEISSTAGEYVAETAALRICKRCKAIAAIDGLEEGEKEDLEIAQMIDEREESEAKYSLSDVIKKIAGDCRGNNNVHKV